MQSSIDKTTVDLVIKEQELKKIDDELKEKTALLNQRITNIYKNGDHNILEVLLKTEGFVEFISRAKLMNLIASQDSKILEEIKDKRTANLNIKKAILDLREKQRERKEEISRLVSQAEEKQKEIENIYNEKAGLLSKVRADKNALLAIENDLEKKEAEISRILESYRYGSTPGSKFMWPVAGFLSSGFGMRIHPILRVPRLHAGIDIVARNGTPIKAADGGQVIQAEYSRSYGYYVLIYHGGGFATRYSHLSGLNVSAGQLVERGQVIGFLGSTGYSTGPHLDFEVRINGVPQNPLQYLQ
ncbi:MAG: M23 family metallopeptidase [Actinobacteria bacterium]|nr:M23 family metallopeptidase [Actinomycetota bacterium]